MQLVTTHSSRRPAFVRRIFRRMQGIGQFPYINPETTSEFALLRKLRKEKYVRVKTTNGKIKSIQITPNASVLMINMGFVEMPWRRFSEKKKADAAALVISGMVEGLSGLRDLMNKATGKPHKLTVRGKNNVGRISVESHIQHFLNQQRDDLVSARKYSPEEFTEYFNYHARYFGVDWDQREYIRRKLNAISVYEGVLDGIRSGKYRL